MRKSSDSRQVMAWVTVMAFILGPMGPVSCGGDSSAGTAGETRDAAGISSVAHVSGKTKKNFNHRRHPQKHFGKDINPGLVRAAALAAGLKSLDAVPIPKVENLKEFLNHGHDARAAAIQLGKALFWDMQVGSDGQACGSCHFHAGADSRARNQLSPGLKAGDNLFGNNTFGVPGFPQFRPDYTLTENDFPFHRLDNVENNNFSTRIVTQDTNDVTSSMGVFAANFTAIGSPLLDAGIAFADPIFNLDTPAIDVNRNVRRVEPRNTPTMINAVFNHSNFWDGRAHNEFNGVSVIGPLDEGARIWINNAGTLEQQQVSIPNSSLASQAVGPPTSNLEMSFFDRPFPLIGRKLLALVPLGQQVVHPRDSVLGHLSRYPATGIDASYAALIQEAFQPQYWNGADVSLIVNVGGTPTTMTFSHIEANFSLFFGLAVQIYETSLVSDKSPFDRFMRGDNDALEEEQLQGLLVFINRGARGNPVVVDRAIAQAEAVLEIEIGAGNCISCHGGPEFTDASVASVAGEPIEVEETTILVDGFLQIAEAVSFLDNGFANIGVRPTADDLGRGGIEGGFPLSFARQALQSLAFAPELPLDECGANCPEGNRVSVDGSFKIPGLRNVELTGPYFHNGGQATLVQVVEFYDRQGDFSDLNVANLERNMAFIDLEDEDEEPVIEFLLSLTDERVRQERDPFDHPQLFVPDGGTFANEQPRIEVPAVGRGGRPQAGLPPLGTFLGLSHTD